jgi:hypothetical protein
MRNCENDSVALTVNLSAQQSINFQLDKICQDDGTAEWALHFELKEVQPLTSVVAASKHVGEKWRLLLHKGYRDRLVTEKGRGHKPPRH